MFIFATWVGVLWRLAAGVLFGLLIVFVCLCLSILLLIFAGLFSCSIVVFLFKCRLVFACLFGFV